MAEKNIKLTDNDNAKLFDALIANMELNSENTNNSGAIRTYVHIIALLKAAKHIYEITEF